MGSDCSHCSNCESGLSEKENELNRHSIEYPKGSIKNEDNQKLTSDSKNKIYKNGKMVQNLKGNGKMEKHVDMGHFITQEGISIKDIGKMIWQMGMEYILQMR